MEKYLRGLGLPALGIMLALQVSCVPDQEAPRPLVLATVASPPSAAIHLALDQGLIAPGELELRLYPSGRDCLAALVAGEVDLATTAETELVHSLLKGERPRILATLAVHPNMIGLVVDRDQGITTLQDLVGKRVAAAPGTNAEYFIHGLLSYHQLPGNAIEVVALESGQALAALSAGEIAGIATWNPLLEDAQAVLGKRALVLSDPAVYSGTWNLVAPGERRVDPERLRRLLRILIQVSQDQLTTPSPSAIASLAEWTGMDPEAVTATLQELRFDPRLDQSLLLLMEDQARWLAPGQEHLELMEAIDPSHVRHLDRGRVTFIH